MTHLNRRTVLTASGAAVAVAAVAATVRPGAAHAADLYASNTALYADPVLTEGVDYGRRYHRHDAVDNSDPTAYPFPDTTILALHGGGIEPGTSELCLAIAGYHPAGGTLGGATYDYWLFEGIRSSNNSPLHVTAINCDDPVARSLVAGARRTVSVHGCTTGQAGLSDGTQAVLVGGLHSTLKANLINRYNAAGIQAVDAAAVPALGGDNPENIANRTLTGGGAQLELTTPLRTAMFTTNTRAQRKNTTTATFWQFVDATRLALQA